MGARFLAPDEGGNKDRIGRDYTPINQEPRLWTGFSTCERGLRPINQSAAISLGASGSRRLAVRFDGNPASRIL